MCFFCTHIYVPAECSACGDGKGALESLDPELQEVVGCQVFHGNRIQVLSKSSICSGLLSHFSRPRFGASNVGILREFTKGERKHWIYSRAWFLYIHCYILLEEKNISSIFISNTDSKEQSQQTPPIFLSVCLSLSIRDILMCLRLANKSLCSWKWLF